MYLFEKVFFCVPTVLGAFHIGERISAVPLLFRLKLLIFVVS